MIRALTGTVAAATPPVIVIDVGGVGYEVLTATVRAAVGQPLTVSVYTVVRAESLTLYGFRDEAERGMFALLLGVSGVGPKSALAILGSLGTAEITQALNRADPAPFQGVKGVGKKGAERLVLELAGSINRQALSSDEALTISSALQNLGYARREYQPLLTDLPAGTIEEQLTWALQKLSK